MAQDFFTFKQFTIFQKQVGMKVATDSCLFGALLAKYFSLSYDEKEKAKRVLDIGCGTGLLSFMYAQKQQGIIQGIDIDPRAISQAKENFRTLTFEAKIHFECLNFLDLPPAPIYDLIFCNPPFFEKGIISDHFSRDLARNNAHLSYEALLAKISSHFVLDAPAYFALLLPFAYKKKVLELAAAASLYLSHDFTLFARLGAAAFRSILFFSSIKQPISSDSICIWEQNNTYTPVFRELLRYYYLYL